MAGSGSASVTRWRRRARISPSCMRRAATRRRASPASWHRAIRSTPRRSPATSPMARPWSKLVGDVTRRFGRLDILVNDAAYNKSIPFTDLDSLTHGGVGQDHGRQPDRADAPHQGGGAGHEGPGPGPHRQHRLGGGARADRARRSPMRCRRRASSTSRAAWRWHWRPRRWSTASHRDCWRARARPPISGPSRSSAPRPASLLKKAADKDDCADMVVTMCRTETMTGQTIVIDSGRYFH